jgi:hypothetical protein
MAAHALFFMDKENVDFCKSNVATSNSGRIHNSIRPTFQGVRGRI